MHPNYMRTVVGVSFAASASAFRPCAAFAAIHHATLLPRHVPPVLQFQWPDFLGTQKLQADGKGDGQKAAADDEDVAAKLFSFFFGAPQEGEVAGIARTGGAPDTYPATKTEFAAPVASDDAEMQILRPLLKNTNLETLALRCTYDAQQDGWNAQAWHSKVDKLGPCIVVARTRGGALCGGYAPKGFAGYGEYRGSIAAFLFSWPDGDTSRPAIKLQKIGGAGLATIDEPETGPRFGSDGLVIAMVPGKERFATSKLGPYYEVMPNRCRSVFAPSDDAKACELTELRTYVGVWPEGERIPFDGAIPFAIE